MKVLLINPAAGFFNRVPATPLGLLSIATYLKQHGHSVRIYDRSLRKSSLKNLLEEFAPDFVGISLISTQGINDALRLSAEIRRAGIPVSWGGQFASVLPELILTSGAADYVTIGEGEITMLELVSCIEHGGDPHAIDSLAFMENGAPTVNRRREFADLRDLPILDWSLVDIEKYFQPFIGCKKMLYIYSSKGCYGHCAFCHNPYFHCSTHRKRPPEYFLEEIRYLIENHGLDGVYFSDELWCMNSAEMRETCAKIRESGLNFHWGCDARIGQYSREDLQLMYDCGCRWMLFGIETGSREMQIKIRKGIRLEKAPEIFRNCREIGITTQATFIVGFPGEAEENLRDTVALAKSIDANLLPFNYYIPIPGSEIYDKIVADGLFVPPATLKKWGRGNSSDGNEYNFSAVPRRDLLVIQNCFMWRSFRRKDSVSDGESYGIAKKVISDAIRNIFRNGVLSAFVTAFLAAKRFFYVFWYSHAYPGIKKKYDL